MTTRVRFENLSSPTNSDGTPNKTLVMIQTLGIGADGSPRTERVLTPGESWECHIWETYDLVVKEVKIP